MDNIFKAIVIYLSIFAAGVLITEGLYLMISNLINPNGLLFEGAMATGLGIGIMMTIVVASTIGKLVLLFDSIQKETINMYELMLLQERNKQRSPLSGLAGMMPNSITITNESTGEESTTPLDTSNLDDSIKKINKAIVDSMLNQQGGPKQPSRRRKSGKKTLQDMNLKELEEELAEAVKSDNFERAEEVSLEIKKRNNKED